ncbi:MAG: D-alanyl-D-alanine carboxypeptidase family protein [Clostridia bacterium]
MSILSLGRENIYRGDLILVNEQHPLMLEMPVTHIAAISEGQPMVMDAYAAIMLRQIFDTMNAGDKIVPVSGYRTRCEQEEIYRQTKQAHGSKFTKQFVALPDCSEHQTGLAIDLAENKPNIDMICPNFPYTGICGQFRQVALEYGFVERYPAGKESITGIAHEPWHFRYVGAIHAAVMCKYGFVLEEYHDFLRENHSGADNPLIFERAKQCAQIFYCAASAVTTRIDVGGAISCDVSGNNVDGFIVTLLK